MANQPKAPLFGLPQKTFWTLVWLVLIGSAALIYRFWTRPSRSWSMFSDGAKAAPPWSGPMEAASAGALLEEETESIDSFEVDTTTPAAKTPHQPIEDPSLSLCPFYDALKKLDNKEGRSSHVRILHYGDSILTTDQLSGAIRRKLQTRFGDGGHGFVLLGRPWHWYHHLDVIHGANDKWRVRPLSSDPTQDGLMGLGAVAFESDVRGAAAWVGTADEGPFGRTAASYDISYLAQPGGGTLNIWIDDILKEKISTAADVKQTLHHLIQVTPGPSRLTVKTQGDGPVRVFGAVIESNTPGVVYDSLAVNGARISSFERIDGAHFREELQHRQADLVVMMCGANEGNNDALGLSTYKSQLAAVLARIRNALPRAGCLVMGPLDQATYGDDGALESKKMPKKLTHAQRETAVANGCAFFDTFTAMGGTGSMPKWVRRGLVGGDFIHPTNHGAQMIGNWLTEALLVGYENFVLNGEPCESNVTSLSSAAESRD